MVIMLTIYCYVSDLASEMQYQSIMLSLVKVLHFEKIAALFWLNVAKNKTFNR